MNVNGGVLDGVRRIGARFRDVIIDGGIPGAPLGLRLRGATPNGPPLTGRWSTGDTVTDRNGGIWTCVKGGHLGSWMGITAGLMPSGDTSGLTDYANIQGLLNLAGVCLLQPGTFYVYPVLQMVSNTSLLGAGYGMTTVKMASGSWSSAVQNGTNTGISCVQMKSSGTAYTNVVIRGITFDGNQTGITAIPSWSNAPSCAPLATHYVTGIEIRDCSIINAIGYSLYLFGCANFTIDRNYVLSGQVSAAQGWGTPNQQDGIHVSASQYGTVSCNQVDTGTGSAGDDAIALQSWGTGASAILGVSVIGNQARGAAAGIDLAMSGGPITDVAITGNNVWQARSNGIIGQPFSGSGNIIKNVTVSGNTIANWDNAAGAYSAIAFYDYQVLTTSGGQGWANVSVTSNTIRDPASNLAYGMYFGQGNDLTIASNTMYNLNVLLGIEIGNYQTSPALAQPVTNFSVTGNTIDMSSATNSSDQFGIIVYDSQNGTISGNTILGSGTTTIFAVAIQLASGVTACVRVNVTGNTISNWKSTASGAAVMGESNQGVAPNFNLFSDNNLFNCAGTLYSVPGANSTYFDLINGGVIGGNVQFFNGINMQDTYISNAQGVGIEAGTASIAPITMSAGTNLTTPTAGSHEFDGKVFYKTAVASSRQVEVTEQFQCLSSSHTLSSGTGAQTMLNATATGAITLAASTAYFFECNFSLSAMSSTAGTFSFGLGGTATFTSLYWNSFSVKSTVDANFGTSATIAVISNSTTGTTGAAWVRGILRVNAAGTVIPQTAVSVSATPVVGANSYFRVWPVGSNTVTNVGDWS